MRAGAQARTIFAGLGVTGCLIAAVGVVFVITGGVLAFQGWPDAPSLSSQPALSVAAAARATAPQHARVLQLPAPAAVSAPGGGLALNVAGGRRTAGQGRQSTAGRGPAASTPAAPGTRPLAPAAPAAAPTPLGPVVHSTTAAVSGGIRAAGGTVPAARPVANTLADTVDRAGHLLGPLAP